AARDAGTPARRRPGGALRSGGGARARALARTLARRPARVADPAGNRRGRAALQLSPRRGDGPRHRVAARAVEGHRDLVTAAPRGTIGGVSAPLLAHDPP